MNTEGPATVDIDLLRLDEFPPVTRERYDQAVADALGLLKLDQIRATSLDGIDIPTLGFPRHDREPVPGRGAGRPWSLVQRVLLEEPDTTNLRIHEELAGGADAIDLVIASGSPFAATRIDPGGNLAEKLMRVFAAVHLDMLTVHFTGCLAPLDMALALSRIAEEKPSRFARTLVRGGFDPCAAFVEAEGRAKDVAGLDEALDACLRAGGKHEGVSLLATRGQIWHSLGASDAQQLAIAIGTGADFLRRLFELGGSPVDAADLAEHLEFRMVADHGQYMTMARLRAFRRLWALVLDAFGIPQVPAFVHAEPAWRFLTRRDPWTNIIRSTIATFAAATGGADAITTIPHTELSGHADASARRLSRNVQAILMDEVNLHRVGDPAAGAGGLEDLTDALAAAAWREFQLIESDGGVRAALRSGALMRRVGEMDRRQRDMVARRRMPITGTSTYPSLAETFGASDGNPAPPPCPGAHRLAEPFEALMRRSDEALAKAGSRPRVFLATLGPARAFAARANIANSLFKAGGIEAVESGPLFAASQVAPAFATAGTAIACLVADDGTYHEMAAAVTAALIEAGATQVLVVGEPVAGLYGVETASVLDFVSEETDIVALLTALHERLGTPASN